MKSQLKITLSASYYQAKLFSTGLRITVADALVNLILFPPPTIYIELLTKDSVALQKAEGREVVLERDRQCPEKSN